MSGILPDPQVRSRRVLVRLAARTFLGVPKAFRNFGQAKDRLFGYSGSMNRHPASTDLQNRITRVLRHMETHSGERLSVPSLARVACISPFHFTRVFAAWTGETPHAFLRRLRLEAAAERLVRGPLSVTEVALDAGYETPEAFTKAFKATFGVPPQDFSKPMGGRKERVPATGKMPLELRPETLTLPAQRAYFVRTRGPYAQSAAAAWKRLSRWAGSQGLFRSGIKYGLSYEDPALGNPDVLTYDACLATAKEVPLAQGVERRLLPGGRFASFRYQGPYEGLGDVYATIYRGWLPGSGRSLRNAPAMDRYVRPAFLWVKPTTEILVPIE